MTRFFQSNSEAARDFIRAIASLIRADGDPLGAEQVAIRAYGGGRVSAILKAAVAPHLTTAAGSDAIAVAEATAAFIGAIVEGSVLGRLSGSAKVPMNVKVAAGTLGMTADFVAQGSPLPILKDALAAHELLPLRVGGACVFSRELARMGGVDFENLLEREITTALTNAIDDAVLDPANAGISEEKPAALTYGLSSLTATSDPVADLKSLVAGFAGDLQSAVLVGSGKLFVSMSSAALPDLGANGGTALGIPAIASRRSPDGQLALIDGSGVTWGSSNITAVPSTEGTVQMADSPSAGGAPRVSLWQAGLIGLAVEQHIDWRAARHGSISLLEGADYV